MIASLRTPQRPSPGSRTLRRVSTIASLLFFAAPAAAQPSKACESPKTTCAGAGGYYASREDTDRVTAVAEPLLKELRACLDAAGAKEMTPTFVIRWDSEGNPVSIKVEAPGYENLPCVAKVGGKLSQLQNPHETAIRCDYGCPAPRPPLVVGPPTQPSPGQPTQPPLVVGPPTATRPAPPVVGQPSHASPYSVRYEKVWYGWQGLITDAIAYTLTLVGGFSKTVPVRTMGLVTWTLGTPIVHMAHAEVGRGFASMGLRIGLPLVGAAVGALAGVVSAAGPKSNADDIGDAAGTGAIIGAFVGAGGCTLVDALALGHKSVKVENKPSEESRKLDRRRVFVSPGFVGPDRRFAPSIGMVGLF